MRAGFGGFEQQIYEARIHSGRRFDPRLVFALVYAREDRDRFYGLGNADEVGAASVTPPVDALAADVAVRTVHRTEHAQASIGAELPLGGGWSMNTSHEWRVLRLRGGESSFGATPFIDEIFAPASLAGLDEHITSASTEVGLRLDGREDVRADMPRALPGSGLRLDLWSAVQAQPSTPRSIFGRFGLDLQQFIDLRRGDRVLRLRLRTVGVVGELDEIPFVDLPRLGGATFLRGYDSGRFRGVSSLLVTAEYRYPVQESMSLYVFADGGRVYARWQELTEHWLSQARLGFGAGLVIFNTHRQLLRLQLASSIDGGFFIDFQVNTTDEPRHG
jgi:outer membrane protein assembly factor BamA